MDDFRLFLELAFRHVLDWKAYDHVLFFIVLAVVYSFKDWKKALWLITYFTIGHTITLALSVYEIISVKTEVVEFLILLTIFITAFVNLITVKKRNFHQSNINQIFALAFGLIHGLGLSTLLKITIEDTANKFLPILYFALGVELAQIVVVTLILLAGFIAQDFLKIKRRDWILVLSSIVIGIILPMLFARKFW
ncbi:MAG: HupE/UreJ family protein [Flavobacteriaceae bacterium]|nr:HupE/UreJ family protein [Flavobacteriaceae bacterium]